MTALAPSPAPVSGRVTANLACMLSMLIWASGLPAAELLIGKVPPMELTAIRMALAAVVLLPLWLMVEGPAVLFRADWGRGILIGGVTIGFGAFLLVIGQDMTDAVTVAVIAASMPVIGVTIEVFLDRRRLSSAIVLGMFLSLAGGVMALDGKVSTAGLGLGAALCFVSVAVFALGSRLTVTAFPELSPLGRTTVTLTGAAVLTGLAALAHTAMGSSGPDWALLGWREAGALALYGVGSLAISQVLWIMSVGSLGIGLASLHINATPFYVMLIMVAAGAAWNGMQAFAAVIVGAGVLVAQGIIPLPRS
ncbi:DMT family transporter [Ostreiculturibacter nitratireducens]|uniref:DMT family transporter n=1 Tax=Ostreiculturibacter nitratireducens TaxID=3075226 RepID=UPI0031B5C62E